MKIYLLDINKDMIDAWCKYFKDIEDVEIVHDYFNNFMDNHFDIKAVVSPANSFGLMDGGYDKAITDYFGVDLMKEVQNKIIEECYGEQPVGTSISIKFLRKFPCTYFDTHITKYDFKTMVLIHTPSMRTPEVIKDSRIIYQCMRTTLIEALRLKVNSVVIPAFGGLTGRVACDEIAKMMYLAYKQIYNQPEELNWGYALHIAKELRQ